jgi:hypothetical protein
MHFTSSIDTNQSWEVYNWSADGKAPRLLWKKKFHYHVNKTPILIPILSQINLINILHSVLLKYILIVSSIYV